MYDNRYPNYGLSSHGNTNPNVFQQTGVDGSIEREGGTQSLQMSYIQLMNYRHQLALQRQAYRKKMLDEKYPVKFVIFYSIAIGILSITAAITQILMTVYQPETFNIYSGIWVSAYLLFTVSLALLVIKKRNLCLYSLVLIFNCFCVAAAFGGLVLGYLFELVISGCKSKYTTCSTPTNIDRTYTIILVVTGGLASGLCLSYVIVTQYIMRPPNFKQISQDPNLNMQNNNLNSQFNKPSF